MEDNVDILEGLEERLQKHSQAFESLLALTPAREYYGSQIEDGLDPSEQWNRKKQTKEQKKAAKKAKLDPANQKSALDVMKERERKRKRELGMEDDGDAEEGAEEAAPSKKQKVEKTDEEKRAEKAEKRRMKREVKKEKTARKKAKADAKKVAKQDEDLAEALTKKERAAAPSKADSKIGEEEDESDSDEQAEEIELGGDFGNFDASGLSEPNDMDMDELEDDDEDGEEDQAAEDSSAPSTPAIDSPAFDVATNDSAASSSSSIVPPSVIEPAKQPPKSKQALVKPTVNTDVPKASAKESAKRASPPSGTSSPKIVLPNIDQAELQERLRLRIEELRAKRKADGPEGKPARSRQELLDQRRKKDEQRKAVKKEQRRKAKEDEVRKREEQLRQSSGSPMSMDMFSPRPQSKEQENNFSFSRLAFEDGTAADASLTGLADARKKKGPQDPRTALEAAQNKQKRISGYDDAKKADIAEKDMWLTAKKRAHGERVRDDTSLLKKALKRKEKQKGKSEEQWQERQENVVKGKEMKQKKREANLAKRREEKGGGGKKGKGGAKGGKKKGGRPGFEGRFKA